VTRVLLDTNVLSELVRTRPDPRFRNYVAAQSDPLISALTIHELAYGAERAPDPARRRKLIAWLASLRSQFSSNTIAVDSDIAELAGKLRASAETQGAAIKAMDALIAASAAAHSAIVATRNTRDFAPLGVPTIDPWSP
jgi:predicted nucleic acid-binding protein